MARKGSRSLAKGAKDAKVYLSVGLNSPTRRGRRVYAILPQ